MVEDLADRGPQLGGQRVERLGFQQVHALQFLVGGFQVQQVILDLLVLAGDRLLLRLLQGNVDHLECDVHQILGLAVNGRDGDLQHQGVVLKPPAPLPAPRLAEILLRVGAQVEILDQGHDRPAIALQPDIEAFQQFGGGRVVIDDDAVDIGDEYGGVTGSDDLGIEQDLLQLLLDFPLQFVVGRGDLLRLQHRIVIEPGPPRSLAQLGGQDMGKDGVELHHQFGVGRPAPQEGGGNAHQVGRLFCDDVRGAPLTADDGEFAHHVAWGVEPQYHLSPGLHGDGAPQQEVHVIVGSAFPDQQIARRQLQVLAGFQHQAENFRRHRLEIPALPEQIEGFIEQLLVGGQEHRPDCGGIFGARFHSSNASSLAHQGSNSHFNMYCKNPPLSSSDGEIALQGLRFMPPAGGGLNCLLAARFSLASRALFAPMADFRNCSTAMDRDSAKMQTFSQMQAFCHSQFA